MKKWLVFMLVFVLAFVIVGCKPDPVIEDVLVTGVTADVTEKEIAVGEKFIIKATIAPANATDKTVTFASDKTTVATVNSTTGEVSGVAPGEAVITVSATNDKTATVTVTVVEATVEVTGVTVIDATKTLEVGEKHQIVATVAPANATDKSVSYTSSDATVATVSEDGEVEALKVGTATIIVKTANNLTATVGITVIADSSVLAITNAPAEGAVVVEDVYKLEANQTGTITWVSKDETIATVDAEGNVTAVAEGTVIIEATLGDETVQVTIVIGAKEDNTFKLTAPEDRTEFAVDFSLTLTASKGDLVLSAETTFEVTMDPEGAVEYEVQEDSLGNSLHKIRLDALLPGTATVKATNGDDVAEYVVTIIERPEPESFEITGNLEIELGNQATMRVANVLPLYAKRTVTWSISDELVATIDPETGVVTPVAEGTVTVTATYTENAEIFATLEITIIPEEIIGPVYVDPEEIFVNGYESIYIDETYQFTASVAPAGASQDVIWTISPETIATITENGKVTGVGLGTANILVKAEKEDGTFVTARFRVTVTEAPVVPDPENLGGYVITIMNAAQALSDQDPFLPEYKGLDKTYKQQAWNEVEALYNCDIQVVAYPDSAPWGPLRWAWVNENANNNTAQADFFILPSDIIDDVHASKALYDTKDLYTSFGKNSMGAGFKESVTFKDGIYGMATGTYAENYIDRGLFYNVTLLEELALENPSQMFLEGRWTYTNFEKYIKDAQALLGEGQFALTGRPYYHWSGMINAAGIRIADTKKLALNLDGAIQKQVAKTLRNIVMADAYDVEGVAWDANVASFNNGDALFQGAEMWFCKTENRWPVDMWGELETKYGYVPFPHPDNMTPEQTRVASKGQSIYAMANFRDGEHAKFTANYQGVYRALNEVFLRTTQYLKDDISMNEQDIRAQNAALRLDDQASIQSVLFYTGDKVIYDPFEILIGISASPINTAIQNVIFNGDDYTAQMEANKASTQEALINIYG